MATFITAPTTTTSTGVDAKADNYNLWRNEDIDSRLYELNIATPVFYKILELAVPRSTTVQARFDWGEDDIIQDHSAINNTGGYDAVATSIVVDDGSIFRVNDAVYAPSTGEIMLVTAISTNTLTVTRGWQGSTGAIIADDAVLLILHFELEEGGNAPTALASIPAEKYNYISQFSRTVNVTELNDNTDIRFNISQLSYQTMKEAFQIRKDIGKQFMWGKRAKGSITGNVYNTGGVAYWMTSNGLSAVGANLTWADFNNNFMQAFEPTGSSPSKLLVCGPDVYADIDNITHGKTTFSGYVDTLGAVVKRIVLSGGYTIDIVPDPYTFRRDLGLQNKGYLMDTAYMQTRVMNGMDLQWKQNIQSPSAHVRTDEIYGAMGLQIENPTLHGSITLS